jgi:hypothetical protein
MNDYLSPAMDSKEKSCKGWQKIIKVEPCLIGAEGNTIGYVQCSYENAVAAFGKPTDFYFWVDNMEYEKCQVFEWRVLFSCKSEYKLCSIRQTKKPNIWEIIGFFDHLLDYVCHFTKGNVVEFDLCAYPYIENTNEMKYEITNWMYEKLFEGDLTLINKEYIQSYLVVGKMYNWWGNSEVIKFLREGNYTDAFIAAKKKAKNKNFIIKTPPVEYWEN